MLHFESCSIEPDSRFVSHGHDRPHLLLVTGGEVLERVGMSTHNLSQNSTRLSPAFACHDMTFGPRGADCLIVEARSSFWARVFSRGVNSHRNQSVFSSKPRAASVIGGVDDITALVRSHAAIGAFGSLFARMPDDIQAPEWVSEAMELLAAGAAARVSRIAKSVQRDRVHFSRVMCDWSGFLPSEVRALTRLARAVELIDHTDARLAEIAIASGYAHQSHMNRAFGEILGATPGRYRRNGA